MDADPGWEVSMPVRPNDRCLSAQEVEDFIFQRLVDEVAAPVEEHLLFCAACQKRVEEEQRFTKEIRAAARSGPIEIRRAPRRWVAAVGLAASLVVGVWLLRPAPEAVAPGTPVHVALMVTRSAAADQAAVAPAGSPLALSVDVEQLPSFDSYAVEVFNLSGAKVFGTETAPLEARLSVNAPPLPAGRYWVRVHGGGELLREFALKTE
jgi:hypothetical protein